MAQLPSASLTINESAGAPATGAELCVVMAPVAQSADFVPRLFGSAQDIMTQYGYAPGVDYAALHIQNAKKPVLFVGMPIVTPGAVIFVDQSGVTGSSLITVGVGSNGSMDECQGVLTVVNGGTVGTNSITLSLSLDNGTSTQNVNLGTGSSYTIPNFGLTLTFGAGTLNPGDVLKFNTTAPMWGSTAITSARTALAAQQQLARSWMVVGDVPSSTFANYVVTEANNYQTANERFVYARVSVSDRSPLPTMSKLQHKTAGANLTFAATGHTITRSSGSFITDGFAVGDVVTCVGSASNNGNLGAITVLTATVMTFASGIANETTANATLTGSQGVTFAAAGFTITRTSGSFLSEGFAVGQNVTITGSTSNNVTNLPITALSATVMTFASGIVNEGPDQASSLTIQASQTMSAWVSAQTTAFASVASQRRVDLGLGRARVQSPIHGYSLRRPAQWAVSSREYQHDVQIPTYRKADGPLSGFSITDANGNNSEFDDNLNNGIGVAGLFTCLRSYSNGPLGAFVSLSLTRDVDGAPLSRTHNMAVADVACTTVQAATENAIGQVLVLNPNGTGTNASLSQIEQQVNTALQINLLQSSYNGTNEGPRATAASWAASRTAVLSNPGATLPGVLTLELNGVIEQIATLVNVQ